MDGLNYNQILARANQLYKQAKIGDEDIYTPPEMLPEIRSDQVKSILKALIEAIGPILQEKEERIKSLENKNKCPHHLTLPA